MIDYPERLQIETFMGCNARCTMCSIHNWKRQKGEMTVPLFERIVGEASRFYPDIEVVSLAMDGEPLMGQFISERVAYCKIRGLSNVGFATNGSLLTRDLGKKLLDAGLDWISFSFDTLNKEVYEKKRVNLKYNETITNIHNFIKERDEGDYGTRINVRYLDHEKNSEAFAEYFQHWNKYLKGHDQIHNGRVFNWYSNEGETDIKNEKLSCPYPISNIVILRDGTVPLCCKDFNASFMFGNVMSRSLKDIWDSLRWKEVRALHRSERGAEMKICKGCDMPDYEKKRELIIQK